MTDAIQPTGNAVTNTMEAVSLGTVIGTLFDWLPKFAVLLAVLWYLVMLWESATVRNLRAYFRRSQRPSTEDKSNE